MGNFRATAILPIFGKIFKKVFYEQLLQFLRLIGSYLQKRLQYVAIDNDKTDIGNVEFGVPQGSVLGP